MTEQKYNDFRSLDGEKQEYFRFQEAEDSASDWEPSDISIEGGFDPLESKIIARMPDLGDCEPIAAPRKRERTTIFVTVSASLVKVRTQTRLVWNRFCEKAAEVRRDFVASEQRRRSALIGLMALLGLLLFAGGLFVLRGVVFPDSDSIAGDEVVSPHIAEMPDPVIRKEEPKDSAVGTATTVAAATPPAEVSVPAWATVTPPVAAEATPKETAGAKETVSTEKPAVQVIGTTVKPTSLWDRAATDGYSPWNRPESPVDTPAPEPETQQVALEVAMTPMRSLEAPGIQPHNAEPVVVNNPVGFVPQHVAPNGYNPNVYNPGNTSAPPVYSQDYMATQQRVASNVPVYDPRMPANSARQGTAPAGAPGYYPHAVHSNPTYPNATPSPIYQPGPYPQTPTAYQPTRPNYPNQAPAPQYNTQYPAQVRIDPFAPYAPPPAYQPNYPTQTNQPYMANPESGPYRQVF